MNGKKKAIIVILFIFVVLLIIGVIGVSSYVPVLRKPLMLIGALFLMSFVIGFFIAISRLR